MTHDSAVCLRLRLVALALGALVTCTALHAGDGAGTIEIGASFANDYEVVDLGEPEGTLVPGGGIAFACDDPDVLLVAGAATDAAGTIYAVPLLRDACGQITGFAGPAVSVASAPFIDGGLVCGPDDVLLYTTFDTNSLGQIRPGSTSADRVIDLTPLGVAPSTGAITIVPEGFPGAGRVKIASYSANTWYDAALSPDALGTFDLVEVTQRASDIGPGPEGIVYVGPPRPQFDAASVLVTKWDANRVDAYEIDEAGDPLPGTVRPFLSRLFGSEGAAIDPVSGDVLFSTLGVLDRVVVVRRQAECIGDIAPPEGDGYVGLADLSVLLSRWGGSGPADLNGDGIIAFADLAMMLRYFGDCDEQCAP